MTTIAPECFNIAQKMVCTRCDLTTTGGGCDLYNAVIARKDSQTLKILKSAAELYCPANKYEDTNDKIVGVSRL